MIIRKVKEEDAEEYIEFNNKLFEESDFLLFEPGERKISTEEQKRRINNVLSSDNSIIFVVVDNGKIVGHIGAMGGAALRNKHSLYLIIGILQKYTGRGLGSRLFEELEKWAKEKKIHRLELTVMSHNENAIKLYKKMGFEVEGTKKHSLFVNGNYIDEYYMAKLI